MVKSRYGRSPRKGSKIRELMLRMLRPEGATVEDIVELYGESSRWGWQSYVDHIRNEKGWDVFSLPDPKEKGRVGRPHHIFRIIGRYRWDGSYRSLIDPKSLGL